MRRLLIALAAAGAAIAFAPPASAALWISLDRSAAEPGQTVRGDAVLPCSLCGPGPLYLVKARHSALQTLTRFPRRDDPRFVFAGRFTWKRGGTFSFQLPDVEPGVYQLMALYKNGPRWSAAPASTLLRARSPGRVSFGMLSMVVPSRWHWRTLRGPEPWDLMVQLSNASLRVRPGLDPIKDMAQRTVVLTLVPLGSFGSVSAPRIERGDFVPRADPSRPRGHALARTSFCSSGGRCFSIRLEYGSTCVPSRTLAVVNRVLGTVRVSPVRR